MLRIQQRTWFPVLENVCEQAGDNVYAARSTWCFHSAISGRSDLCGFSFDDLGCFHWCTSKVSKRLIVLRYR
ncbi:hypothetical protein BDZ91DRAFT_725842 [Kalaharituber pfeilii]|nr:hypothetical protein BDZ91DRAFT_725842 [Kalaharituber pfeilii]